MIVLTFASLKGGVGKTTLATSLAACLASFTRTVLVDADPQGSASAWAARAAEQGRAGVPVVAMGASALVRDLPSIASSFDVAIVDTPARLGAAARGAIIASTAVFVPSGPGAFDAWANAETLSVLEEARALRPELLAALVLNRVDRSTMARSAERALSELGLPLLGPIPQRVAFVEAAACGMGVTDYAPRSDAALDVRRLTRAVLSLLGLNAEQVAA